MDCNGDIIIPDAIDPNLLGIAKIKGEIMDYEINPEGVMVIKEFKIDSVSI
jgi:hypothetical protein